MRVAIIDLGTNSVRFDVHALSSEGKAKLLHREKLMIRLGQGVFLKGRMDPNAVLRAVHAFRHFQKIADDMGVKKIVAFGTSALREARDGQRFVEKVREATGIDLKIISGAEEAKLIAQGILANEKPGSGRFGLIDIGGGSTELSICQGKQILHSESFRLGTARLQQVFLKRSPPKPLALAQLRGYIRNLVTQKTLSENWPKIDRMIGSSGTVKSVARILDSKTIDMKDLSRLIEETSVMTTTQLLELRGMEAKRVDMFLAGAVLLEETAYALGVRKIIPTEYSLRDGIIEEEKRLAEAQKSSLIEFHLEDLYAKAGRCGLETGHLRHMANFAGELFDRLKPLHRLEESWKIYLLATVILRNTGEVVGLMQHEKHSFYIVKNSDFPSMQGWEKEFIARLCLFHGGGKIGDLDFLGKDKRRKNAFRKLTAMLRVIDALDLGPQTTLVLRKVRADRKAVRLSLAGKATAGLENLMVERKKKLFEEEFGRTLYLERVR